MTAEEMKNLTDDMPLAQALWWYIENKPDTPDGTDVFFHLRERMRNYTPYAIATGNPFEGMSLLGPFDNAIAAGEATYKLRDDWRVVQLQSPEGT